MKLYKVFFEYDKNEWELLNSGLLAFPNQKKEEYSKRNEFNNLFVRPLMIENEKPCVNTFDEIEIENSLFFFLDFMDAVKYTQYSSNKFGNFNNNISKYKILELEFPDELVLRYLGVGNYEFERDSTYNLSLEVAIPFNELSKSEQCVLLDTSFIQLNNAKIYDENSKIVMETLNYISSHPNYKNSDYLKTIESVLNVLGFQLILGSIYKRNKTGKERFIANIPQYKSLLLSELFCKIQKEIEENKVWDYDIRTK